MDMASKQLELQEAVRHLRGREEMLPRMIDYSWGEVHREALERAESALMELLSGNRVGMGPDAWEFLELFSCVLNEACGCDAISRQATGTIAEAASYVVGNQYFFSNNTRWNQALAGMENLAETLRLS